MIIELSGIDGCGKTTQSELLQRWANERGLGVYERRLRPVGKRVLGGIAQAAGHRTWRDLYDSDSVELMTAVELRQQVFEAVLPISFPGQLIVTDTYVRMWLATALSWGANPSRLIPIYSSVPAPDVSIFLRVPTEVAYARILARPRGDHILRFGGQERLAQLAASYEELPKLVSYEATAIDGTLPVSEVFDAVRIVVEAHL